MEEKEEKIEETSQESEIAENPETKEVEEYSAQNDVPEENKILDEIDLPQDNTDIENSEESEIISTQENLEIDETISEDENNETNSLITVRPVKFKEIDNFENSHVIKKNYDIMQDILMHISVELGKTKSTIKDVMALEKGSIVELDKIAGEQVEIYANGKLVAKGEVIVIEDKFGVRIISTNVSQKES